MNNSVFSPKVLAEAKKQIDAYLQYEAEKHVLSTGYDVHSEVGKQMVRMFIAGHTAGGNDFLKFFSK